MEWRETGLEQSYCRIEGMDPSADWVLGPGFSDFSSGNKRQLIPCTIGPLDTAMVKLMKQFHSGGPDQGGWESGVFIPRLYHDAEEHQHIVGFVRKAVFDDLARGEGPFGEIRMTPKHIDLSLPLDPKSLPEHWKSDVPAAGPVDLPAFTPSHGWPKDTVVIGIIDDGIAFAHERFRLADGTTRVQYFWRQDGTFDDKYSTVDFGSEICKVSTPERKGIDQLLREHSQFGIVDEEGLYLEAGLIDFRDRDHKAAAWGLSHGTHVLDLAAGYNSAHAPTNRPIIAVQLPVSVTADTAGSNLKTFTQSAIRYILDRADRLAGKGQLPVVINFSYGMIAGPHDGTLDIEQTIDKFAKDRENLRVVLPAGNSNLSRCHATVEFDQPGEKEVILNWRVQPDDYTPTLMELWMPHQGPKPPDHSRVTVHIETPSGLLSPALRERVGSGVELVENGKVIACAHYCFRSTPAERGVFHIGLQPTSRLGPIDDPAASTATVPEGVWKIIITNSANTGLRPGQQVQAWIQWDDVIYGYSRRGRQSYFEADGYHRFDAITGDAVDVDEKNHPCVVRRAGLVNAIATGHKPIVVGGVQQRDLKPPKYAAGGPVTPTCNHPLHRSGPDVACVSDDSRIHEGVLAAGSRSGSAVTMSGTSVSVPQIVREIADMMAKGSEGDRNAICQVAKEQEVAHEKAASAAGTSLPPLDTRRCGAGRIVLPRPDRPRRIDA